MPADIDGKHLMSIAQRFTLPTETGYVDSLELRITAATGDVLGVYLWKDTIHDFGGGLYFHAVDILTPQKKAIYGSKVVNVSSIPANGTVKVKFNHVKVPKDFFVVVQGNYNAAKEPISFFTIAGEIKARRQVTMEESRSSYLALSSKGVETSTFDSKYKLPGVDSALFTDFHITAHTTAPPASVGSEATMQFSAFPNPVTVGNPITVQHGTLAKSEIRIINSLGATIKKVPTDRGDLTEISTTGMPAGAYHLFITSSEGQTSTAKMIVTD